MPKKSIFSPSAKIKICTLSKAPPPVWPHHQHTHKTSKNFTYGFVLGPLQFQSTGQNTHLTSKAVILAMLAFKKNSTHLHSKPTNTEPSFRKLNSPPTKLRMLFPAHLQARELCPQTYSLSLPLEWSQVAHIPASIKSGGAYKPEKSAFYSTFARQLCDDTRLPGGSLPFHHTHKHSSPLRQALHTQIANHHIQQARKSFYCVFFFSFFFKCWRISSKFHPATWKCRQTTTKGRRPHQRDMPPLLIRGSLSSPNSMWWHHNL